MGFRFDVLKESVEWAEGLYEVAQKLSIRLEDKAQQTSTMAGLFLAAAFGFLKPDNAVLIGSHRWVTGLMTFAVVMFLLCLGCCLSVTWLRPGPMPLGLKVLSEVNEDLLKRSEEELTDRYKENYLRDRLNLWDDIINKRTRVNEDKALRLRIAQTLLAVGMSTVGILLFIVIRSILIRAKV